MKKVIFFIFFMILIMPAFSATWHQISDKIYVDLDSIEIYNDMSGINKGNIYSFWIKSLNDKSKHFTDAEKDYNQRIWYNMTRTLVDCKNKTLAVKSFVLYDLEGSIITSYEAPSYYLEWQSIVPDTLGEEYYYNICMH